MRSSSPLVGLVVFAAWIAAEIAAFNLVASLTGGGLAFFLLIMKSVLGAVVVQRVVRRKLSSLLKRGTIVLDGAEAAETWLKGLGAALLIAPGFAAGLIGLGLLTPSVRRAVAGRSAARRTGPRDIDLADADWREIPKEPTKRVNRPRQPGET